MATPTTQDRYVVQKVTLIQSQIRALRKSIVEDVSDPRKYKGSEEEERYKKWLNKLFKASNELSGLELKF